MGCNMTTAFSPAPAAPFSEELLAEIDAAIPYAPQEALATATALRKKGYSPEDANRILTQAKLRTLAAGKFGEIAGRLLLTEAGFEQATRAAVARRHALRFVDAGVGSVADLGCGIGADSLAFAEVGLAVTAVELDPATAALTAHNLAPYPTAQVLVGDVEQVDLPALTTASGEPVQALWLDPARREVAGGSTVSRIFAPEAFSPPLSFVEKLAATGIPMGVKMGPGLPHEHIPAGCEAEWVSHNGSVVEVVLWFNALARPGVRRSVTLLGADPVEPQVLAEMTSALDSPEVTETHEHEPTVSELGAYLYEPDGAVVRAHLVSDLAHQLGARLLDENIAYLTLDEQVSTPLATGYRVLETLTLNDKVLRRWVKEQGITVLTVKKRGVDIVPEQLRAKLLAGVKKKKGTPGKAATLVLTRLGSSFESKRLALAVEPLAG